MGFNLIKCFFLLMMLSGCEGIDAQSADDRNVEQSQSQAFPAKAIQSLLEENLNNMVFVEGGYFMMGDGGAEDGLSWTIWKNNKPAHQVTLDSYYIGKYEISYREHDIFAASTGREPSLKKLEKINIRKPDISAGVSWFDAKDYCQWLGDQTGLPFDLPTEAQWEYAARNRGENVYAATDNGTIEPGRNYHEHIRKAIPPGQFPPNPLGIHDMSGNVIEWVKDWYDAEYYRHSPVHNPTGPEQGTLKIRRGGSFLESPEGGNVYTRQEVEPDIQYENVGFRCALNISKPPEKFRKKIQETLQIINSNK